MAIASTGLSRRSEAPVGKVTLIPAFTIGARVGWLDSNCKALIERRGGVSCSDQTHLGPPSQFWGEVPAFLHPE